MATSSVPGSATSTCGSGPRSDGADGPVDGQPALPEGAPLDLDGLPAATGADAEALAAQRPGGLAYADYFRFLAQFPLTAEELRALPLASGPRFVLE